MSTIDERRAGFQKYKHDVKERGKPFFPYAMFHDTVMSLVVVCVIVGLACVWYFTSHEDPAKCQPKWNSCVLGPRYAEPADPGTTNFVPRPDWYFYFLFYLLRIFKWPDSVVLGTVGVPTILLIIAIALPFLDTRRERRLSRRPVAIVAAILVVISMGELTYKGAVAKEALASEVVAAVPSWTQREGFANDPKAVAGATVFAQAGCTACHTYLGTGGAQFGAPDLSAEGTKGKGVQGLESYISDPSKFGNNIMPKFGAFSNIPAKDANGKDLGISQLAAIATFLNASKGPK
jgi:quinol---cytochrome c reductase cytochrome c subunit, bacillus type